MSFLQQTAEHIWQKYGDAIDKVCIVLPNKRGGLFLKKYLAAIAQKTIWAPRITSIEELIGEHSGYYISDKFNLLFDLYAVHKKAEGEQAQPFEEFLNWAPVLLQDFNDVDQYLADADHLYKYLDAAKISCLLPVAACVLS
jgi:ATP-dependent helicase/nuclease subunit B